ncbi:hypothetical protein AKJ16_DCAP12140, partial [Drosera capensis]
MLDGENTDMAAAAHRDLKPTSSPPHLQKALLPPPSLSSSSPSLLIRRISLLPVMLSIKHQKAVVYKGILHWREYNNRIIAYDIMKNAHQCRLIDMPKDRDRDAVGLLGASKECFRSVQGFEMRIPKTWWSKSRKSGRTDL